MGAERKIRQLATMDVALLGCQKKNPGGPFRVRGLGLMGGPAKSQDLSSCIDADRFEKDDAKT